MSRAAHPVLAPLVRGGGTAARLVASLAAAEARAAALDVDLEAHPLCRPGAWEAFALPAAVDARLEGLLARAAAHGAPAEARSAGPGAPLAPEAPPASATPAPASRRAGGARRHEPAGIAAAAAAAGASPAGSPEPAGPTTGLRRGVAGPLAAGGGRVAGGEGVAPSRPRGLAVGDDPVLRRAADRPVAADAADLAAAVARVLAGEPAGGAPAAPRGGAAGQSAEARIADALARIADRPPQARRAGGRTAEAGAGRPAAAGPPEPGARRDADLPAPRHGLERLLARGRRESLVPAGQAAGVEARLATDQPAEAGARRGAATVDLATSRRGPRALPPPDAGAAARTVAGDPDGFARALADILRREARSAGIDLKGGR